MYMEVVLCFLLDKKNSDYRNLIKEFILVVELFCKIIIKDDKMIFG